MSQDRQAAPVEGLVQISKKGSDFSPSRRSFLKILGATSAVGLAACADSAKQNILPNVKGDAQQIPGVSVWYNSTCTECGAGCGISVRTREGRAVKIEGNPLSPVNKGGICAMGQSSLQGLYDPDRIRQPLKKSAVVMGKPTFKPVSWEEALTDVATWLGEAKKKVLVNHSVSGAVDELLTDFSAKHGIERGTFELLDPSAVSKASELAYGVAGVPTYRLDRARTVVNFGSDFLETWVSPCEYARDWAIGRKKERPLRLVHVEPRLSLTGANADLWLSAKPGTEIRFALALLKIVTERGRKQGISADLSTKLQSVLEGVSIFATAETCGIAADKITLVAEYLLESSPSLVLAGGTGASTEQQVPLMVVCNLLNLALGNVGETVLLGTQRPVRMSVSRIADLIESLNKGDVDLLFVTGTNPVFALPSSYGFEYAAKRANKLVSFSSYLDETAMLADLILPAHHSLEDWGDSREIPGVYSLVQPAMTPVFDTRSLGDTVLQISERAGKQIAGGATAGFQAYLKDSWKKVHTSVGSPGPDFNNFWRRSLEQGGYFGEAKADTKTAQLQPKALELSFEVASFDHPDCSEEDPIIYPFPSVKSFDGRAANKPWMQELADPISQVVWDSWAEIHPDTAKRYGLASKDMMTIRNFLGEINVPVYVTPYVHPGVVAVPIGQGHTAYGRFAKGVGGGNVLDLLPALKADRNTGDGVSLLVTRAAVMRGPGRSSMVNVQGSDSQLGRGLAQTAFITSEVSHAAVVEHGEHAPAAHSNGVHGTNGHGTNGHGANGHGANGHSESAHHEPKQMYNQRPHPAHKWGLAVDLATCTGCAACVVACYAENNIPVVGKERCSEGREMAWLRIERYYEGPAEELQVSFLPMMCQHCGNAPCEPVCPVYATYHNEEGLNAMIYNRCVGTRYCSNNCSYKVRRFNWFDYEWDETVAMQLNPDVMVRSTGVMEKCTFCVQRIAEGKDRAKDLGRSVQDGEIQPACVQGCSTQAMVFGDLNDPNSRVSKLAKDDRAYKILDHHLNTQPAISYLKNLRYKA